MKEDTITNQLPTKKPTVRRYVCVCGGRVVRYSRVNLICKRCSKLYDGE